MNPALVAVVRASPSVCRKYATKMSAPSTSPGTMTRRSRPVRPSPPPAVRRISGIRTRIDSAPKILVQAMNANGGRYRRASFAPGKVAPHMTGVSNSRTPASIRPPAVRRTDRTLPYDPLPPLQWRDREGHLLHHHSHLLRQRRPAHRARLHHGGLRRDRPVSPPSGREGLLPHRDRRARAEGGPCGGGEGARSPDVDRSGPPPVEGGVGAARHLLRRLHPHHR